MNISDFEKINSIAKDTLILSRNTLLVNLRFLDSALSHFRYVPYNDTVATDGLHLYYNPIYILKRYKENNNNINRMYLHMLFHCIYRHMFIDSSINRELWNLACDIAVENTILELQLKTTITSKDFNQTNEINKIKKDLKFITAEKVYRYLLDANLTTNEFNRMNEIFLIDDHEVWYISPKIYPVANNQSSSDENNSNRNSNNNSTGNNNNTSNSEKLNNLINKKELESIWKDVSERMQMDLETFSKRQGDKSGSLVQNLTAINKEKYDYTSFLKKFSVMGETMKINDDEFDYIFYTYGLQLYKKMPLIEPLEYKDEKRIKDFVIAIDTSGSVQGNVVQKFLNKTFNILKSTESFFSKINVHIIQCDTEIQEDVKITSQKEFDDYIKTMQLHGFGGTDFRPIFTYVDELICKKEFVNLKGLIYFTDGYGVFPKNKPNYNTAFVFVEPGLNNYDVPSWAIKLILESEDIMNFNKEILYE